MKRTTIFLEEQLERELQALARRGDRPVSSVVREALEQYVASAREQAKPRLGFIAVGQSGTSDTAERHEELLWTDEVTAAPRRVPADPPRPGSGKRGASRATGALRRRR
jgi:predicted transcriptional regulator